MDNKEIAEEHLQVALSSVQMGIIDESVIWHTIKALALLQGYIDDCETEKAIEYERSGKHETGSLE